MFNFCRGRLEPIRLILQEAGIPYREVNFDKETWPKHKKEGIANGLLTFGQGIQHTFYTFFSRNISFYSGMSVSLKQPLGMTAIFVFTSALK